MRFSMPIENIFAPRYYKKAITPVKFSQGARTFLLPNLWVIIKHYSIYQIVIYNKEMLSRGEPWIWVKGFPDWHYITLYVIVKDR